jgi:hypothetical protein
MKNFFRLKPENVRLFLAVVLCVVFFMATDTTEDKKCATHKYGNLVLQNKASDKRIEVELAALSYKEYGMYNRTFSLWPSETLPVNDIRTGIYLCLLRVFNTGDNSWADFRNLTINVAESKTTTVSYP